MDANLSPANPPSGARRAWIRVGVVSVLILAGLYLWFQGRGPSGPRDPRLAANPYRNIRPEVRYVGDQACQRCHANYNESYHGHPMGRSLAPVAEAERIERFDAAARNPFSVGGFRYSARRDGERMFHTEERVNAEGQVVVERTEEVHYAVGSGQRGRSYLIEKDGALRMSPLTWYPEKGIWDLSPGYEKGNQNFNRPILNSCLFCHANRAHELPDTLNQYQKPIFSGYTIGCERCHGPGELHVARYEKGQSPLDFDDTIVNPGKLEPKLREAVCQQCHLSGVVRVEKRGRAEYDFRPGLPLEDFLVAFVEGGEGPEHLRFVGHSEQMQASRCFTASAGKLGCVSCHDPHRLPAPAEKTAYYNGRCASCHSDNKSPCTTPLEERRAQGNNCTACHMPDLGTQINHTAVTDHRVPRRPRDDALGPRSGRGTLVPFSKPSAGAEPLELERDLAIALVMAADGQRIGRKELEPVVGVLQRAVARDPSDLAAEEAYALALSSQGRHAESLRIFEAVLARLPRREFALVNAATEAKQLGRADLAIEYWKRASAVNPTQVRYLVSLARICIETRAWEEGASAARQALALQAASPQSRQYLVRALLGLGRVAEAEAEFATLMRLDPPDPEGLRRWFAGERGK